MKSGPVRPHLLPRWLRSCSLRPPRRGRGPRTSPSSGSGDERGGRELHGVNRGERRSRDSDRPRDGGRERRCRSSSSRCVPVRAAAHGAGRRAASGDVLARVCVRPRAERVRGNRLCSGGVDAGPPTWSGAGRSAAEAIRADPPGGPVPAGETAPSGRRRSTPRPPDAGGGPDAGRDGRPTRRVADRARPRPPRPRRRRPPGHRDGHADRDGHPPPRPRPPRPSRRRRRRAGDVATSYHRRPRRAPGHRCRGGARLESSWRRPSIALEPLFAVYAGRHAARVSTCATARSCEEGHRSRAARSRTTAGACTRTDDYGLLIALDAASGLTLWTDFMQTPTQPVAHDGRVYGPGGLVFDGATGQRLAATEPVPHHSPRRRRSTATGSTTPAAAPRLSRGTSAFAWKSWDDLNCPSELDGRPATLHAGRLYATESRDG